MQFTFNEGHIQLPSQWQDQSMQVLVSTDNSGINLVITREAVPQGTLTPELYQETLALYQGKLDGYTEHACREITLADETGSQRQSHCTDVGIKKVRPPRRQAGR